MKKKKRNIVWKILLSLFIILCLLGLIFTRFGGFNTGKSANVDELKEYAKDVSELSIPKDVKVVALGEATHGNAEFQELKLDVFKNLVENYGVKAFAIEGDFSGCEKVNDYIHIGEGTAQEAAASIGFKIYQTDQIVEIIEYMRDYNEKANDGEDLRFYGFDMQRYNISFDLIVNIAEKYGVDISEFKTLLNDGKWNETFEHSVRVEIVNEIKTQLENVGATDKELHTIDVLLQYLQIQGVKDPNAGMDLRDALMAENVEWILNQEQALGNEMIFITGHNSHVAKWGSYDAMGKLLEEKLENQYYVIGTDFYKTKCNLPTSSGKRTNQVFYSHNPLAKAAKEAKLDQCYLDFTSIPEDSELGNQVREYTFMGNLGEQYSVMMRLLPPSYRMFQPPAQLYDAMIIVTNATPIEIIAEG